MDGDQWLVKHEFDDSAKGLERDNNEMKKDEHKSGARER
jgi:hypothetical protein